MNANRLEAFSDGVIAIIITIMVLDLKVPHGTDLASLHPVLPIFMCYVLSFLYLATYWNNHHHMLHTVKKVNGAILWANLHLLFWLSLFPFVTGWMGENHFAPVPTLLYGVVLLCAACAYFILQRAIINSEGGASILKKAIGKDIKGWVSLVLYVTAISVALFYNWLAQSIYALVAVMWLVPDRRIEKVLK